MSLPKSRKGLVVGYDFLFCGQADAGMENASKPHPAAIILSTEKGFKPALA